MVIIAIILSSLALSAALACIALVINERKCNQKRSTALMQYADSSVKEIREAICALETGKVTDLETVLKSLSVKVADLEGGVIPDYEKAKAAADAVNNFNAGITGILGFDPHEVLKKQRNDGGVLG